MDEIDKLYKLIKESYSIELEVETGDGSVMLTRDQENIILSALDALKTTKNVAQVAILYPNKWFHLLEMGVFERAASPSQIDNSYGPFDTEDEAWDDWSHETGYARPGD